MATPSERLAVSLEVLKEFQDNNMIAIRSTDISSTHRERLLNEGVLQEVMKGYTIKT